MVIAKPGLRLTHTYWLSNEADRPVRLLRAVNYKSCCGEVRFTPITLSPGQKTAIEITLKVDESTEPLSHLAVIETDHPEYPSRQFFTFAKPHPRLRLVPEEGRSFSVPANVTTVITCLAIAYGTPSETPAYIDEADVSSDAKVVWSGPSRERLLGDGLIERSRPLSVTVVGTSDPGDRISYVQVSYKGEILGAARLRWEILAGLKASPSALLISRASGASQRSISLRSQDGTAFRVMDVVCDLPEIRVKPIDTDAKAVQIVQVDIGPSVDSIKRSGHLTIRASHPSHPVVKVPVFIVSQPQAADHRREP